MLLPKKRKFRKDFRHRGHLEGKAHSGNRLAFGAYGLKATSPAEVTSRQIEAARRAITHYVKRGGKIWIRIFPHMPITKKGAEVPMGSGKGMIDHYIAVVRPGAVIFEMDGVEESVAREALRLAGHKLPTTTKFISEEII